MSNKCTRNNPISAYAFRIATDIEEHFKDTIESSNLLQAKILSYGAKLTGKDKQEYNEFFGMAVQRKGKIE